MLLVIPCHCHRSSCFCQEKIAFVSDLTSCFAKKKKTKILSKYEFSRAHYERMNVTKI